MKSIACGLKTYQNELSRLDLDTGSLLDTTEVTLALKASATGSSELVVDGSAAKGIGGIAPIGLTYSDKLEQVGSRENTIKLTFKNMYTAGLNKAGETLVRNQKRVLGPSPRMLVPVDRPCDNWQDPVAMAYLKQLREQRR